MNSHDEAVLEASLADECPCCRITDPVRRDGTCGYCGHHLDDHYGKAASP